MWDAADNEQQPCHKTLDHSYEWSGPSMMKREVQQLHEAAVLS